MQEGVTKAAGRRGCGVVKVLLKSLWNISQHIAVAAENKLHAVRL